MNRRRLLQAGLGLGVIATASVGCSVPTYTVRYRVRLVVRVDGRLEEGSSIIETQLYDYRDSNLLSSDPMPRAAWGEAIVVDLGKRGLLFGLLTGPSRNTTGYEFFEARRPERMFLEVVSGRDPRFGAPEPRYGAYTPENLARLQSIEGEFEMTNRPALVRFLDINDPTSAQMVDPAAFSAVYGADARFVSATMSTTKDPITAGIDVRLPWLDKIRGALAPQKGGRLDPRLAGELTRTNFKMEGR